MHSTSQINTATVRAHALELQSLESHAMTAFGVELSDEEPGSGSLLRAVHLSLSLLRSVDLEQLCRTNGYNFLLVFLTCQCLFTMNTFLEGCKSTSCAVGVASSFNFSLPVSFTIVCILCAPVRQPHVLGRMHCMRVTAACRVPVVKSPLQNVYHSSTTHNLKE